MLAFYLDFLCLLIWCLFCGCWFEVWPVAVLRAAECMWGAPAWRTEAGGYTQMDTQMLQQTVVRLQFIDFWTWKQQLQGFGAFSQCTVVMKPLYLNSWGQCLCSVKCDFVFSYEFPLWTEKFLTKNLQALFFSQEESQGEIMESSLNQRLPLHQCWASESCSTCHRPFVQLSLHSAADALHTLAGVKCCQAHLWPSV